MKIEILKTNVPTGYDNCTYFTFDILSINYSSNEHVGTHINVFFPFYYLKITLSEAKELVD